LGEFASEWNPIMPAAQRKAHGYAFDCLHGDFVVLYSSHLEVPVWPQAIPKKLYKMSREVATLETQFGELLGAVT